jgi:peptidoglycan/LPS O-acetylase OafA/YrhL
LSEGNCIEPQGNRFIALEGVRGLAAILVVIHHFLFAFYPVLILGPGGLQHTLFEDNIHGTPVALLFAGTFAVAIFFVLSGFVLTIGFFQTKNEKIIKKLALKRYLRLMIPALAATLICYILIKMNFYQYIAKAGEISGSGWFANSWNFDPSLIQALYSGTIGIFVEGGSAFDNVLWTMITEFAGSFIVFAFVLLFGTSKHRWISYILVSIFTFNTWFLPFILGMALADLQASGRLEKLKKKLWIIGALIGAVIFGSFPVTSTSTTMYNILNQQIFTNIRIDYSVLYLTIGATLLILAILISKRLSNLLQKPRVSVLGKYTFSLYLVHVPILFTVGALSFLALNPYVGYNVAVLVTMLIYIPVIAIATVLFERYVDAPAVKFSSVVGRAFENNESFELKKYLLIVLRKLSKLKIIFLRPPTVNEKPFVD